MEGVWRRSGRKTGAGVNPWRRLACAIILQALREARRANEPRVWLATSELAGLLTSELNCAPQVAAFLSELPTLPDGTAEAETAILSSRQEP